MKKKKMADFFKMRKDEEPVDLHLIFSEGTDRNDVKIGDDKKDNIPSNAAFYESYEIVDGKVTTVPDVSFQRGKTPDLADPLDSKSDTWDLKPAKGKAKPITYTKRDLIIFVVENTQDVNEYSTDVLRLINKIIEDNKSTLFLFLRTGNNKKYFEVSNGNKLKDEKFTDSLLSIDVTSSQSVDLADALNHISEFFKSLSTFPKLVEVENVKYSLTDINVIFIGTGKANDSDLEIKECKTLLKTLRSNSTIKTIKYFCMKDSDAINASLIGFPIIGHIESDFYK